MLIPEIKQLLNKVIPRPDYEKEINTGLRANKVLFLLGMRQAGKTYLIFQTVSDLLKKGASENQIFYYDLEDPGDLNEVLTINYKNALDHFEALGANRKQPIFLFLDELQYHPDPTRLLRPLSDFTNLRIVCSGSSTVRLKTKFKDSLAGRKREIIVRPLDFIEFLHFKNRSDLLALDLSHQAAFPKVDRLFEEYVIFGGLPRVVLALSEKEKIAELNDIWKSWIQRDLKDFVRIDNIYDFNRLVSILAVNTASLLNFSDLQSDLKISFETLKRYISLLEMSLLIKTVRPFFTNKRKEIVATPKIFWQDTGLRNITTGSNASFETYNQRPDGGALFENAVFNLLERQFDKIYFWRKQSGAEVDFVIETEVGQLAIEAKLKAKKLSVPRSLRSFLRQYPKAKGMVINTKIFGKAEWENYKVPFVPPLWKQVEVA